MPTPLMKNTNGNDAPPNYSKDCDYTVWMKSIHRTAVDYVCKMVCPQQLGIGVSSGVELKNVTA
jgi:hypothetical protein